MRPADHPETLHSFRLPAKTLVQVIDESRSVARSHLATSTARRGSLSGTPGKEELAIRILMGRSKGNEIAEALVIPFGVRARDEFPDRSQQMTLAQWDDVPQTFLLNRSNEPLSKRVQIRPASG